MFQNLQPVKSLINSPVIVTHENIDTLGNISIDFLIKKKTSNRLVLFVAILLLLLIILDIKLLF